MAGVRIMQQYQPHMQVDDGGAIRLGPLISCGVEGPSLSRPEVNSENREVKVEMHKPQQLQKEKKKVRQTGSRLKNACFA